MQDKKTRKGSKWQHCHHHAPKFGGLTRRQIAENMVEGGPAYSGYCQGGTCKLWPGIDFYVSEICYGELPLSWTGEPYDPEKEHA